MKHKNLVSKMSLSEKASLFSGKDFWTTKGIERLDIPELRLSDGPYGIRCQEEEVDHLGLHAGAPATCFPTSATIANSWDKNLAEKTAEKLGKEAISKEVDVILGPGLNIKRSPLCGRNFEYFSEDPYLSGKIAASYIRGIQSNGIAACPKHFAVNNQELLRMTINAVIDERSLREIYLTAFEIAVKEGKPKTIMTSYNQINGEYANEHRHLLEDILVDDWGFDGFVVTDWGGSNDHLKGVKAGSHLEMPGTGATSDLEIIEAVKDGKLSVELLDQRVDEFLDIVLDIQTNKLENNFELDIEEHHNFARKAAEESMVLLKNKKNILPLVSDTKVAVIGDFAAKPRYQGSGSSMVNPTKLDNSVKLIKDSKLNFLGYEKGFNRYGKENKVLKNSACELAEKAEVVLLYLGLDESTESEGMDRKNMKINQNQIELLKEVKKYNENIVVILSGGSAVEMSWIDYCQGLVYACLPGQAGAKAILNVLTGEVNPSGKLNETFPLKYSDTPAYNYFPGRERTVEHREAIYIGYRYFDKIDKRVQFPFGYGLSYTNFEYSDLKVSKSKVSFSLKNTGELAGAEVAQLYIGLKDSDIFRAEKELKGFKKIYLEAGEKKEVVIEIDDKAFRYFNIATNRFEIEAGEYQIYVGSSSRDIRLQKSLKVEGNKAAEVYEKDSLSNYYSGKIKNVNDQQFEELLNRNLPDPNWDENKRLELNDSVSQLYYADSLLARLIYKVLIKIKEHSEKKGDPNLNVLYLLNMPFRAIAKMSGGMINKEMSKNILEMVNGNLFSGLGHFITNWFKKEKKVKELEKKLAGDKE